MKSKISSRIDMAKPRGRCVIYLTSINRAGVARFSAEVAIFAYIAIWITQWNAIVLVAVCALLGEEGSNFVAQDGGDSFLALPY